MRVRSPSAATKHRFLADHHRRARNAAQSKRRTFDTSSLSKGTPFRDDPPERGYKESNRKREIIEVAALKLNRFLAGCICAGSSIVAEIRDNVRGCNPPERGKNVYPACRQGRQSVAGP